MTEMIKVNDIDAYLARPDGEVKQTVIVIHEVWGLTDHIKSIADRLAAGGYLALAPDLLSQALDMPKIRQYQIDTLNPEKRTAIQPSLRELMTPIQSPEYAENTITQLKEVFNYLHNMPEAKQRVAVMGFCFGGTYSFNLAVAEPRLTSTLAFYGHANQDVDELSQIKCPVMAFYGEQDERLIDGLDELKQKMNQAGVNFEHKVYPNCGHAFFNDTNPHSYNEAAAKDAWSIVLEKLS